MRWRRGIVAGVLLIAAAPAIAVQDGASGSTQTRNGASNVIQVDGGDSASGTTRAANTTKQKQRRADDCTAQTDGEAGEICIDDLGGVWKCEPSSGGCDTAAEWTTRLRFDDTTADARTIANVSGSGHGTLTLDPATSYVPITCSDADGCDVTMSETSARDTRRVVIWNVSANPVFIANVTNVVTMFASPWRLDQNRWVELRYVTNQWQQAGGMVRMVEGSTYRGDAGEMKWTAGNFAVTCTAAGSCTMALDSGVSLLGQTIEKAEATDPKFVFTDQANTYTAGPQALNDNVKQCFGTGNGTNNDACISYDGTDWIFDPDVVGSGSLDMQGPFKVPRGTATAPTTQGKLYLDTDGASIALAQPCIGDGTTCTPIRQCWVQAAIFQNIAAGTAYANFGGQNATGTSNAVYQAYPYDVKVTNLSCFVGTDLKDTHTAVFTLGSSTSCSNASDGAQMSCTDTDSSLSVSLTGTSATTNRGMIGPDTDIVSVSANTPTYFKLVYTGASATNIFARCTATFCPTGLQ